MYILTASDFGGVWYWNRYPGARVDSETPFYQLNIPAVYNSWNFSQRFPDHAELRAYMAHVDSVLGLRKDVTFNAHVNSVEWNAATSTWTVRTESGLRASARWLVLATGLLHRTHTPDFPGLAEYGGLLKHSGAWDEGISVKGKKVAIVGAGATSVQIVQEVGKEAEQLTGMCFGFEGCGVVCDLEKVLLKSFFFASSCPVFLVFLRYYNGVR